jgi:hypothetical protein
MSSVFDASLIESEPLADEILAKQAADVTHLMERPNALSNAKLHAERELPRLVMACNKTAWDTGYPSDTRAPSPEEAAALFAQLGPEKSAQLKEDLRSLAVQRNLVALMTQAQEQCEALMQAAEEEYARHQAEEQLRADFEAYDEATKEQRYAAWLESQRR